MTGQSCCRSLHCFSFARHCSITSHFWMSSSNESLHLLMSFFIYTVPVCFLSVELFHFSTFVCRMISPPLWSSLHPFACWLLPVTSSLAVIDSNLCFLFPFPLSSSLFPQVSNTQHNQSAGTSSHHPYIPKPLSPLCHPSFCRFSPPSSLPAVLYLLVAPLLFFSVILLF